MDRDRDDTKFCMELQAEFSWGRVRLPICAIQCSWKSAARDGSSVQNGSLQRVAAAAVRS